MEKLNLVVPKGIRYISDWDGYRLEDYPFPHILDKVLTGCGFTEYCLRNNQNLILCSPRKMLLENKERQHKGEIYYARNDIYDSVNYDRSVKSGDLGKVPFKRGLPFGINSLKQIQQELEMEEKRTAEKVLRFKNDLLNYYYSTFLKPRKIIVTYDSFKHVKEALQELGVLDQFQVVIDEFQSVLVDVKFKTDAELMLLNQLRDIQKVCFVSATPMMDKYLERIDEFKDLPYYHLDWKTEDPGRIISPNLMVKKTDSIFKDIVKVVGKYKDGQFEKFSYRDQRTGLINEIESREAVLYVNSVKTICTMIIKCELSLDNTNVLCARTEENSEKIRKSLNDVRKKLGLARYPKGTKVIGDIPGKGDSHKMFTFCTRTVYLGADFYSTNARTFIFSDSNIDCLSVDISLDLPQILGRQRLDENPWKNSAEIYVISSTLNLKKEDFDKYLDKKVKKTNNLLKAYNQIDLDLKNDLANNYLKVTKAYLYKDDYVSVDEHSSKSLQPVFNKLMLVAEERTFDIQQIDYKDRVSIFNTLQDKGFTVTQVDEWLEGFNSIRFYHDKMKFVCHLEKELGDKDKFNLFLNSIPISFKNYYTILGPEKCKACCYQKGEMEKAYQILMTNQEIDVKPEIIKHFKVGERYTSQYIKCQLGVIYKSCGYKKSPMAVDLKMYYNIKACRITNPETGKRDPGFELIERVQEINTD